jgi:hypothetical protein
MGLLLFFDDKGLATYKAATFIESKDSLTEDAVSDIGSVPQHACSYHATEEGA